MKKELVIIVDKNDKKKGSKEKVAAHLGEGTLHRAFIVFVFDNNGRILLQKRSKYKMLWPLYWDCSCASHNRLGESYEVAGERRLKDEIGFSCSLKYLDKFQYKTKYKNIGSENEICAILLGRYDGKVSPNPEEVADWKWIEVKELKKDIVKNPQKYTLWLKIGLQIFLKQRMADEERINLTLETNAKLVNPIIERLLSIYVDKKHQDLVKYQVSTGGKRLRPTLAIVSCQLLGGKTKNVIYPAAGLEILHNYSLIIDDIIDNSILRRKKPTVWAKFGKSMAECIAIDYSAAVFQAANRSSEPAKISEIFAKSLKEIVEGEILDILFEQAGRENEPFITKNRYRDITEKDYIEMITKKTAILFQICCEVGAICAKAKIEKTKALKSYGYNLGIVFQITDDILDIFGKEKDFGKKIGKDIEERKGGNILIIYALKELSRQGQLQLRGILRKKKVLDSDIKKAISLIKKTCALQKAVKTRDKYIEKAMQSLKIFPQNKWRKTLEGIANYIIERNK